MNKDELFKFFHNIGLVPVVKIDDAAKAVPLAKAMIEGGIPCAEVTFRTAAAEEAIRKMSEAFPEMMIGAGTVINPELAEKAVNAGAKFIVSPGLNPATVEWCLERNIPVSAHLPISRRGSATASTFSSSSLLKQAAASTCSRISQVPSPRSSS